MLVLYWRPLVPGTGQGAGSDPRAPLRVGLRNVTMYRKKENTKENSYKRTAFKLVEQSHSRQGRGTEDTPGRGLR